MINTDKIFRKIIQIVFGFDKWHVSTLKERPYAVDVIGYCNKRFSKNNFAEIGCGLGDIIRNVSYKYRKGFDADRKVLKAAKVLPVKSGKHSDIQFEVFNFPDSKLYGKYDVITMVNWIHHIEPEILKNNIVKYLSENVNDGGEIIIDTVRDKEYRYNHDINYTTEGVNCSVTKIGSYAREREVFAIKKIN